MSVLAMLTYCEPAGFGPSCQVPPAPLRLASQTTGLCSNIVIVKTVNMAIAMEGSMAVSTRQGGQRENQLSSGPSSGQVFASPHSVPASAEPVQDLIESRPPFLDEGGECAVLPMRVLDMMPLPWKQQFARLLQDFVGQHGNAPWPIYQVRAARWQRVTELGPEQQRSVGIITEVDALGDYVYRYIGGGRIEDPEEQRVLAPAFDPLTNR